MAQISLPGYAATARATAQVDRAAYGGILALGALLYWLSVDHPAAMPVWAPWDFSPVVYLATTLTLFWYLRGLALTPADERPQTWRRVAFYTGLGLIYGVLQTRFEYWSQHMFFINRLQHVAMHHLGPFLIGLGFAGGTLKRGMPAWVQRACEHPGIVAVVRVLQQPIVAAVLFSGSFFFWLIPSVHFRAMIDVRLYALMNWTMVLDGLLFWALVLDPRPKPLARISYGTRVALATVVIFPQIALGAFIAFSSHDLYPYYDLCGRLFTSMDALYDQEVGGIIIWIPPAMMSVVGVIVIANALRIHEDSTPEKTENASAIAEMSRGWTGR